MQVVDQAAQVVGLLAAGGYGQVGSRGGPRRAVVAVREGEQGRGARAACSVDGVLDETGVGDDLTLEGIGTEDRRDGESGG